MEDKRINKGLFDKISARIEEDLGKALTSPKLTQTSHIDVFSSEIATILSAFYYHKDLRAQRFASILNSIYTHANNGFILTYRLGNDLINEDVNHKLKTGNGKAYNEMLHYALKGGYITCLREPIRNSKGVNGQAGFYKLTDEDFLNPLYDMIGRAECEANVIERLKWFDKQKQEASPAVELTEEAKRARAFAKELERMRNER